MYPSIELLGLSIPSYFLTISIACIVSALWFIRRSDQRNLARVTAIDLTLVVLVSGFLGARVLHVAFEDPKYYTEHWTQIFAIWNGGFVFLGGVVAALFGAIIFCQQKQEPFWYWADIACLPIALGYAIGRFACFLNGCCYGRACDLPWAIDLAGGLRHPTQLYAVGWELLALAVLIGVERHLKSSGLLFNLWLILHAVGRLIMEVFRDDPRGDLILGSSLGTWMALVLLVWAFSNLLRHAWDHRPSS